MARNALYVTFGQKCPFGNAQLVPDHKRERGHVFTSVGEKSVPALVYGLRYGADKADEAEEGKNKRFAKINGANEMPTISRR